MDDENSKVRRNLIAVSVLMILVWWLQAPLDKVSEKFFGLAPSGPVFEWRVWLAAALALCYFALRFRFSSEHQEAASVFFKEISLIETRFLKRWIAFEIWMFMRWGLAPRSLGDGFRLVVDRATRVTDYKEYVARGQSERLVSIRITSANVGLSPSGKPVAGPRAYQVRLRLRLERTDGAETAVDENITFALGRLKRLAMWLCTRGWLLVYTQTGSTLLIPWALALTAAAVAAWKLAISW